MKKKSDGKNKYVFGPVVSRRLGLSLGVDLVKAKTCTLDCIYCECGPTDRPEFSRKEYIPTREVISEIDRVLSLSPRLDYVTFSGSGEPTLHSGLGKIISFIKEKYSSYRVAVLTNSSLLHLQSVRDDLKQADVVSASLDAVSGEVFKKINRPCFDINANFMVGSLKKVSAQLEGRLWVEIFIVPGLNDTKEELQLIKSALSEINPSGIHLNTLDRPGTEESLEASSPEKLREIQKFLLPLKSFIIAANYDKLEGESFSGSGIEDKIMALISRRPSTFEDMREAFAKDPGELEDCLLRLCNSGRIEKIRKKRGVFYKKS